MAVPENCLQGQNPCLSFLCCNTGSCPVCWALTDFTVLKGPLLWCKTFCKVPASISSPHPLILRVQFIGKIPIYPRFNPCPPQKPLDLSLGGSWSHYCHSLLAFHQHFCGTCCDHWIEHMERLCTVFPWKGYHTWRLQWKVSPPSRLISVTCGSQLIETWKHLLQLNIGCFPSVRNTALRDTLEEDVDRTSVEKRFGFLTSGKWLNCQDLPKDSPARLWWLVPVILATQEAEIRRITVWS
jgi:hypothetical protein